MDEIRQKLKIEMLWNELIYIKYKDQVKIDKDDLIKKIENSQNKKKTEYLIYEIVFKKNRRKKLRTLLMKLNQKFLRLDLKILPTSIVYQRHQNLVEKLDGLI